jgi:hypothetical protein
MVSGLGDLPGAGYGVARLAPALADFTEAHLRRLSARVILADCTGLADAANLGPVSRAGP